MRQIVVSEAESMNGTSAKISSNGRIVTPPGKTEVKMSRIRKFDICWEVNDWPAKVMDDSIDGFGWVDLTEGTDNKDCIRYDMV